MPPNAPTCLSTGGGLYTNGKPYILLFWSQNDTSEGTFAQLEFCTGAACSGFAQFDTAPVDAYSTGYGYDPCAAAYALRSQYEVGILQTVQHSTLYRFRIRNERGGSTSSYSNIAEFTTAADPGAAPPGSDTSVPNPPTNLVLSGSGNTIDLDWSDNATNETGFSIEKRVLGGSFWGPWTAFAAVAADTVSYSDTGLLYQTTYGYRVRAYNDNGFSGYSNEPYRTTGSLTVSGLAAPSLTSATLENVATDPRIKLIWTDPATTETAYFVERSSSDSPSAGFTSIASLGADVITYTDESVFYGVTYTYRVRSYRSSDGAYSPYSGTKTVSVPTQGGGGTGGGTGYGIAHDNPAFTVTNPSIGGVIRDNQMRNNGLGNIAPNVYSLLLVTIDNPGTENIYIRRGQILIT